MLTTICRQLPALLTSVSNFIAGSVLPPSLGRGGVSVCEGAFPYVRGRYFRGSTTLHPGITCFS